jgi:hypothetical protein
MIPDPAGLARGCLMVWDSGEVRSDQAAGPAGDELASDLTDAQVAALKDELAPGEPVLWMERAGPPPSPTIGAFPALFAAVLCGASGFALMVLFGIYGLRVMSTAETIFFLSLAPGALGFVIVLGVLGRWSQYLRARRRLSRTFYALTDRRVVVGSEAWDPGRISIASWTPDLFDDLRCIEHPDGSGDVFFVRLGEAIWPEEGLVAVARARHVETLVRQALLGAGHRLGPILRKGPNRSPLIISEGD